MRRRADGGPGPAEAPGRVSLRVRYVETDQMGMAHHSSFFAWYEVGRTEYMRERGLPYTELEKEGVYLPVIEAGSKYHRPVSYDAALLLESRPSGVKGVRVGFSYRLLEEETGALVAEGFTVHAVVNREGRPLNLKKRNPLLWERITAVLGGDGGAGAREG